METYSRVLGGIMLNLPVIFHSDGEYKADLSEFFVTLALVCITRFIARRFGFPSKIFPIEFWYSRFDRRGLLPFPV